MLLAGTLAFAAGILLLQTRAVLPPEAWLFGLPLSLIGLLCFRRYWVVLPCCLAAGFLWAQFQAHAVMQQALPADHQAQTVRLEGYVCALPQQRGQRTLFEFAVSKVLSPEEHGFPRKLRLAWYRHAPPDLQPGQLWRLSVRMRSPHSFMDPGAFDYSAWLLQKGIVATGYVSAKGDNRLLRLQRWRYPLQSLRFALRSQLVTALQAKPTAGLLIALVLGDRSAIDKDQWTLLQQTGTVHLMAISGLHIGLIAGLVFFLVTRLWRRFPAWCLWLPAPKAAAVTAWLAAAAYAALAGFAIPTQRALIMLAVLLFSIFFQRVHKPVQMLALALLLILIWDPLAVLSAGFWLSFSAVGLIYYLLSVQTRRTSWLQRWWRMQLAISLGLMPLLILFFQQAPLVSPLSNLLAIPWLSILVLPLSLCASLMLWCCHPLGVWGLSLAAELLQILQHVLLWLSQLPMALTVLPAPPLWILALALIGVVLLFLPVGVPARYLGVLLCLPLFLPASVRPPAGEVRLTLLDVGQGLAVVIQTAEHTLVFDSGPRFSQALDAGEAVIAPFLYRQNITRIDTLIISHGDMDHIGGAGSLIRRLSIRRILSTVPAILRGGEDTACRAGKAWQWDGVGFRILYPDMGDLQETVKDNNRSCVLQVRTATQQVLLTADIEAEAESRLRQRYGPQLQSGILVVPHHGSKTSSSAAFLDAVQPELALIPAGWHNRFGLPAEEVLARLRARRVTVLSTAAAGAIRVDTGARLQVATYRARYRRYWQHW